MNLKQHKTSIRRGFLLGLSLIWILLTSYFADIGLLTNVWVGLLNVITIVGFGIYSILSAKKVLKGFLSYREAFTAYFITAIIGNILVMSFTIFLFNGIMSPEDKEIHKNNLIEFGIKQAKANALDQAKIDEFVEKANEYNPFDPIEIVKPVFKNLMRDILIGLILALAFRNKREYSRNISQNNTSL